MKTLFIGQNAIHLTAVDSTNSYASEMLRQMRPTEGTIIYTFEQNKGRGQRGNNWLSEPNKNVALSLIIHPSFLRTDEQFLLTKTASLAVADLMAETLPKEGFSISIKWPNDIYINDRKIAGILIENILSGNSVQSSIIGIGINVNQVVFDDDAGKPVSLKALTGQEYGLKSVIENLCSFMEARYLQLKTNKRSIIDHDYITRLYRLDQWKQYESAGQLFEGKIRNVSGPGKLQMELHSGEIKEFDLKEISFI